MKKSRVIPKTDNPGLCYLIVVYSAACVSAALVSEVSVDSVDCVSPLEVSALGVTGSPQSYNTNIFAICVDNLGKSQPTLLLASLIGSFIRNKPSLYPLITI